MGIAKHPSRVSLPIIDKPYPTILTFLVQRFPKVGRAAWEQRIREGKVFDDEGAPVSEETPYRPQKRPFHYREVRRRADHPPAGARALSKRTSFWSPASRPFSP